MSESSSSSSSSFPSGPFPIFDNFSRPTAVIDNTNTDSPSKLASLTDEQGAVTTILDKYLEDLKPEFFQYKRKYSPQKPLVVKLFIHNVQRRDKKEILDYGKSHTINLFHYQFVVNV